MQVSAHTEVHSSGEKELLRNNFVSAMAKVPTAVTLVAFNDGTKIWGQTVSAFASVTADPPTLLVCLNSRSPLHDLLTAGKRFSVSVLAPNQNDIANCFAGKSTDTLPAYGSHLLDWDFLEEGVPLLKGAATSFACEVDSVVSQGTHGVIFGRVFDAKIAQDEPHGLAYCNREYRKVV